LDEESSTHTLEAPAGRPRSVQRAKYSDVDDSECDPPLYMHRAVALQAIPLPAIGQYRIAVAFHALGGGVIVLIFLAVIGQLRNSWSLLSPHGVRGGTF
jgi:hypothetical protein